MWNNSFFYIQTSHNFKTQERATQELAAEHSPDAREEPAVPASRGRFWVAGFCLFWGFFCCLFSHMDVRIRLSHSGERKKPASPWGCVKDRPREHTASAMSQPPARARGHLPACSRPLWGDRVVPSVRYSHLRLVLVLSLHLSVIHEVSQHDNIRRRAASCPHVNSRPPPPAFSFHSDFRAVFLGLGVHTDNTCK